MPVQVSRTRLQLSQKLWVSGVMKPKPATGFAHAHIARGTAGAVRARIHGEVLRQFGFNQ